MIGKLALRNAVRHGKSSLLILFFMTAVGMVFMGGNSLLLTINRSLQEGLRSSITADAVIMTETRERMCLFGADIPSIGEFFTLPSLPNKGDLESRLDSLAIVKEYTPLISGSAMMEVAGYGRGVPFFGIDTQSYFSLFSGVEILEGSSDFIGPGILVSQSLAREWEREKGEPLRLGDAVKFSTLGDIGFSIRLIPVKGIYRYSYSHPLIDSLVLMDAGSARALVRVLADQTRDSSPEEASDLLNGDPDDFFSADFLSGDRESEDILSSLNALFHESPPETGTTEGGWHFLLVRFAPGSYKAHMRNLKAFLAGDSLQVLDWRQAAGASVSYAHFIQLFFYGGFSLILLAGILGIVNIMLISLFQRTVELGTIQALGGTSRLVRGLLNREYLILSLSGGLISLILSRLLFLWLNGRHILLGNSVLNMVFGGKPLYFPFSSGLAAMTLGICLATGWISSLYPIGKMLKLEPVDALKGGRDE